MNQAGEIKFLRLESEKDIQRIYNFFDPPQKLDAKVINNLLI